MANDAKLIAILSYVTIVGWIIAMIMHQSQKTKLGGFHIRQSLMIMITGFVLSFIPIIGWFLSIFVFILWIMGLIYAIEGKQKKVPVIGDLGQRWFKGL